MLLRVAGAVVLGLALPCSALAQGASFDGVYRGEASSGTGCSLLHPVLRVEGGTATLRYNPSITFEGKVGSDGSLDAPFGQGRLSGKFAGGKFQGSVVNRNCQYPLALAK